MVEEEKLLRYLDGELDEREKDEVEVWLEKSPGARQMLQEVRLRKKEALEALRQLDPAGDIPVPGWNVNQHPAGIRSRTIKTVLRWAAVIVLPIAVFFLIRGIVSPPMNEYMENGQLIGIENKNVLPQQNNIDYAISPNRNWTKKQMIDIEITFNTL